MILQRPQAAVCQPEQPQPFAGPGIDLGQDRRPFRIGQRAHSQHDLRSAFQKIILIRVNAVGGDHVFGLAGEHLFRQTIGVIRQIMSLGRVLLQGVFPQGHIHRPFEVVAEGHHLPGPEGIRDVGAGDPHPAFGQRSGFIGADRGDRSEGFDGQQPLHQSVPS